MTRLFARRTASVILSALVTAASSAQSGGPAVPPAGGMGGGLGMSLFKETTVMVSEQEQAFLDKQREAIAKGDKRRAKADKARRDGYGEIENAIIASNYKQFKGLAEGEKAKHPSSGDKAIERIKKIEDMKRNILRFERYYDEGSEEVASLISSLEDYYAELEGDTYTASSFAGELIVRGEDYGAADDGWRVTVYSELFGLASLFRYRGILGYKEMIKKGGSVLGSKGLGNLTKEDCVMVADSLFARAVPMLFATLTYKVARGVSDSQYLLIPVSLELARTDNLKVVLAEGREGMTPGSFYMDPQLAVSRASMTGRSSGGGSAGPGGTGSSGSRTTGGKPSGSPGQKQGGAGRKKGKDAQEPGAQSSGQAGGDSGAGAGGLSAGNPFMEAMFSRQKKRRVLLLTMDTAIYSLADYNIMDLELNSIKLNFEFANKEYFFYGGGLSWRYAGRNSESFYGAFVNAGANVTLFRNFRPYVLVEASANTGAELGLGAGCGLDVTIKHLLLNANWAFNWSYDADLKAGDKSSTFATAGFGIGFTW
ncbi:MAG: hypothetical protein II837_15215 [Treponema sp.]|nr:hypothetical protein [Treponema sp.]